jgi:molybdopterin adenylyltransferase
VDERIRIAILTVSDGVLRGTRQDASGDAIARWVHDAGWQLTDRRAVPDERPAIEAAIRAATDGGHADVIVTTGGTGLTVRDVTPEATRAVIDREAPGLAEALRADGARHTPFAWLSRGVAGTRARTLIVNMPGSVRAVEQGLPLLTTLLPHAVQLLRGVETGTHPPQGEQ